MVHFLSHVLGLDNASGGWYLWWSGIGADLGLFGAPIVLWRRHNCEVHGCLRLGRHKTAAGHMVCRRHHPAERLTAEDAVAAHEEALG